MKHAIRLLMALALLLAGLAVTGAPARATESSTNNDQVCRGLDSGKIDVNGNHKTVTVTAPAGKLIDGYCVKAGSTQQGNGPQYETVDPPVKTITFGHDSGKDVSHYSVSYTDAPQTCQSHPTPQNCPKPNDDVEKRSVQDAPNCETDTVTTRHEERTRTYVWDGNSWEPGAWSAWVTKSTTTRDATEQECPDDFVPDVQVQKRNVEQAPDCVAKTVTTLHQERTRTETSEGVWGEWSEWTTTSTTKRDATEQECPDEFVPDMQVQKRAVEGEPNCKAGTVRVIHQERTRTEVSEGVWGEWSEWVTTGTTEREATERECPPEEPPCVGPCEMPVMDGSKGDLRCVGTVRGGVYDNVVVPKGKSCSLVSAYVNGSVKTRGARDLWLRGTPVRGDVTAVGVKRDFYAGSKRICAYDPFIGGTLTVKNSHNVLGCHLTVCEAIEVVGNDGKITLRNSTARRLVVTDNRRFVRDRGDNSHANLSWIRLINTDGDREVIKRNAPRKVVRR